MPIHNGSNRYLSKQNSLSVLGRPVSRTRLSSSPLASTVASSSLTHVDPNPKSSVTKRSPPDLARSLLTTNSTTSGNPRTSKQRSSSENKRTAANDLSRERTSSDLDGSGDLVKSADDCQVTPLPILPAVPRLAYRLHARSNTLLSDETMCPPNSTSSTPSVYLQATHEGKLQAIRSQKERDKYPDRINLDRRGLSHIPLIVNESKLRLLSVQHNLISSLDSFNATPENFSKLVFLDLYDNQIERLSGLDLLTNLRVLLLGKNRIKAIEGLRSLIRLEVLDLHGNQIAQINNLATLGDLKVLNLAGNQIRAIGPSDLEGLKSLQELNLRRNRLQKLLGFAQTPRLVKLFLNNNQLQNIDDMASVVSLLKLEEINVDENPVATSGSCTSYLVSYLPSLLLLNKMAVTSHVREVAATWRSSYECSDKSGGIPESRRDQVIYNARTNWELLRTSPLSPANATQSGKLAECANLSASLKDLRVIPEEKDGLIPGSCIGVDAPLSARAIQIRQCKRDSFVRRRTLSQESASSSQNSGLDFIRLPPILISDETGSNKGGDSGSVSSSIDQNHASPSPLHSPSPTSSEDNSSHFPSSDESDSGSSRYHGNCMKAAKGKRKDPVGGSSGGGTLAGGVGGGEFKVTRPPYRRSLSSAHRMNSVDRINGNNSSGSGNSGNETRSTGNIVTNISRTNSTGSGNTGTNNSGTLKRSTSAKSNSGLGASSSNGIFRQRSENRAASKVREQGGDYLIEINGRYLNIYGQGSLRFIDRPWNPIKSSDVTTIRFNYINFNSLTSVLNKIKTRFPNIEYLEFKETNIYCLGQINAIADIQGLTSLYIHSDGNSIVQKKDWRAYAIYRLAHWGLKIINDVEVSEEESLTACSQFSGLGDLVLSCLPDSLLEPLLSRLRLDKQAEGMTAKQWLHSADPALKSVLSKEALQWRRNATTLHQDDGQWRHRGRLHLNYLIELTSSATGKLNTLQSDWGSILNELVRDILVDYSQMDTYMRRCMDKL